MSAVQGIILLCASIILKFSLSREPGLAKYLVM